MVLAVGYVRAFSDLKAPGAYGSMSYVEVVMYLSRAVRQVRRR